MVCTISTMWATTYHFEAGKHITPLLSHLPFFKQKNFFNFSYLREAVKNGTLFSYVQRNEPLPHKRQGLVFMY